MPRAVGGCLECGEEREMAADGLCFTCYRRKERAKERADDPWAKPDRHATQIKKAQRKGRKSLMAIMAALEDLEDTAMLPVGDISAFRKLLKPAVDKIGKCLVEVAEPEEGSSARVEVIKPNRSIESRR